MSFSNKLQIAIIGKLLWNQKSKSFWDVLLMKYNNISILPHHHIDIFIYHQTLSYFIPYI